MRVVLLTHGGADLVIERLAALENVEIAGVFIETRTTPQRPLSEKIRRSIRYDGFGGTLKKLIRRPDISNREAAEDLTRTAAATRRIAITEVENFHSEESIALLRKAEADLGVVYGTNIIKESVFSIPKLGSINLHQGLAPYYRGGPPVFWELFNDEKEIGLTAHFVAAKVDTGDIVLQKRIPLEYDPAFGVDFEAFIDNYRGGLREHSARLVADAAGAIAAGDLQCIPQDTSIGKRYRLPTKKEKDELRRRLRSRLERGAK